MQYRKFGRIGWDVSEIGYGMWGMGSWTGSEDAESLASLQRAVDLGCNFFDTAFVYGEGRSEKLLGQLVRANPGKKIYVTTKVPPKNQSWPPPPGSPLQANYPADHITEFVDKSLRNLGMDSVDLIQFHTWHDLWLDDSRFAPALDKLKSSGKVRALGISLNRWQTSNGVKAVRSGLVDSVQVIYNIFDQNPEDELFPACREKNVAVIARVPFDEGSLTGTLSASTTFPKGDWRNTYFVGENLRETLQRLETLQKAIPAGMTMPELALRFILSNPDVSTTIPGMRKLRNVEANIAASGAAALPASLLSEMKKHRWDRKLTPPSFAARVKRKLTSLLPGR
jgi:aryl-alcohol dehydrogenase-like predicted oxidoreductase